MAGRRRCSLEELQPTGVLLLAWPLSFLTEAKPWGPGSRQEDGCWAGAVAARQSLCFGLLGKHCGEVAPVLAQEAAGGSFVSTEPYPLNHPKTQRYLCAAPGLQEQTPPPPRLQKAFPVAGPRSTWRRPPARRWSPRVGSLWG